MSVEVAHPSFRPIQAQHFPVAYKFLRDAFQISFGEDPSKWPNNLRNLSENNYAELLEKKLIKDPSSVIHVWLESEIVGQIESSVKKNNPECEAELERQIKESSRE